MSVYKDLAKWLIGFLPVTTLVTLGVALAPSAGEIAEVGLADWLCERRLTVAAVTAVLVAMVVMIIMSARVLMAEPSEWNQLAGDQTWMSRAFSHYAVGRPHFLDSGQFDRAELASRADPLDSLAPEVKDVTARILSLSADLNAKARFRQFLWAYTVGAIVVVGGAITVLVSGSGGSTIITDPTPVAIHVPASVTSDFTAATGCTSVADVTAIAVGGTWDQPDLRLFGEGCNDDEWSSTDDLGILVTVD